MDPLQIAFGAFVCVLAIGIFLYFRPKFLQEGNEQKEGFATVALDGEAMPKCLLRDADAQGLLAQFQALKYAAPNSDTGAAYDELKMVLQKVLCIDADITGSAAGPYSTYQLPFVTAHDAEPAASFVGRCVRHSVRSRDVEYTIGKYEDRGKELIAQLCFDEATRKQAMSTFHNIVARVTRNISRVCIAPKANLDHPSGVRDPGYYEPENVQHLQEYTIQGDKQYLM